MARQADHSNNVRISGEGRVSGGTYDAIVINGAGSVRGDIECDSLRVNGAGSTDGNVKARSIVVNGTASFGGEVQAVEMTVNGDSSVTRGVGVSQLKVKGRCSVGGGLAAHGVESRGEITVAGDLDADSFQADGAFSVGGLLNAGEIDVRLYGSGKAREIGGERIAVRQATGIATIIPFLGEKRLTAETIEGDVVNLECTTAKVVRGTRVVIGPGCSIDLVEYTEDLQQDVTAAVRQANKVGVAGS